MVRIVFLALALSIVAAPRIGSAEECKPASATSKVRVTFAPESSLLDLGRWLTGFTCKNVVFASDVARHATRLTVLPGNEMTPKQAVQLFVDAIESTGLVVTQKPDTFVIKLGPKMPRSCPDVAATGTSAPGVPPAEADDLADAMQNGIRVVSDTEREISRDLIDKILANPMGIAKGARIVPAVKNGKPDGFKLYAIRPSSIYARLGFTNGDTLKTINGFSLDTADKALEVYTKVREAKQLDIELDRRGKPLTIRITIK